MSNIFHENTRGLTEQASLAEWQVQSGLVGNK